MGVCLFLETSTGSSNSSICNKRFYADLIQPDSEVLCHSEILTEEQIDLLIPQLDEENTLATLNPEEFKIVIETLQFFLQKNDSTLPKFHWFMKSEKVGNGRSQTFTHNGKEMYFEGIHLYPEKRDYVLLREVNEISSNSEWVLAEPEIKMDGIKFKLHSSTMLETYNEYLEELIGICNKAINSNEQVIWSVSF